MKPLTVLKKAQKLISKPAGWCKGKYHKTTMDGVQHCAEGTLWSSALIDDVGRNPAFTALSVASQLMTGSENAWIIGFNDAETTTHADVMEMFEVAKALVPMVEAAQ